MIEKVTNHIFIITDKNIIPVGSELNELLYKVYAGELIVRDVIVDPALCKSELEVSKIIVELFRKCPKRTYSKAIHKLLSMGMFVYADEFLNVILTKWQNLKFKDLTIKYKSPHNTIKLSIHLKQLL